MAGPSQISGIAGVVQVPYIDANAGMGESAERFGQMAERLMQMKAAKQATAQQKFGSMMEAMEKWGLPLDEAALRKTAKEAGMPLAKEQDMAAYAKVRNAPMHGGTGQGISGVDPNHPEGAVQGPRTNLPGGAQAIPKTDTSPISTIKDAMNPEQQKKTMFGQLIKQVQSIGEARIKDASQLAQFKEQVDTLKNQYMQTGSMEAIGKLAALGEVKPDLEYEKWSKMSDKQRQDTLSIMAGAESTKDIAARSERIGEALFTSGKFSDPTLAYKAGDAIAHGGDIPAEIKAQMKPFTFKDLSEQGSMVESLIKLGVKPTDVGRVARNAQMVGLENALPTGIKPIALQELELQKKQVGIEGERLGLEKSRLKVEESRYQAELAKVFVAESKEEHKQTMDDMKAIIDMKKAGVKIPQEIWDAKVRSFADATGLDVKETPGFLKKLTGMDIFGDKTEFVPRAGDVSKFTGKGQTAKTKAKDEEDDSPIDENGTFNDVMAQKISRFIKGKKKHEGGGM